MIKTLQKRFVMAAMAAITLLLVILLGAINGMNYWTTEKEITRTLIILSEEPQQSVKQQNEPPVQPEGNLEKLFDRFYRADTARTQKKGGYGIGLSVARVIANAHGEVLQPK